MQNAKHTANFFLSIYCDYENTYFENNVIEKEKKRQHVEANAAI